MNLPCWLSTPWFHFHDPGAVPVIEGARLRVRCRKCLRLSPGVPIVVSAKHTAPVVYESRQILRLVKRA